MRFEQVPSDENHRNPLEVIKRTLESGEDVLISGFGKFRVREKKARRGRNPQTGGDLMLRPRRVVTFQCSSFRDSADHEILYREEQESEC